MSNKVIFTLEFILNKIQLPETQLNTSFVDIINIDNIFKIGYSGTLDIELPNLLQKNNFTHIDIVPDFDEQVNIDYAINNSKIISILPFNTSFFISSLKSFKKKFSSNFFIKSPKVSSIW